MLFTAFVIILYGPYNKQFAYSYVKQDSNHSSWVYKRVFKDVKPIDIAFVGSSRTLNGVNDSLLELYLNKNNKDKYNIANISFSWTGRNLQYILLKDLFRNKKTKIVVVEIREKESPFGHIAFPVIAEGKDIVFPQSYSNVTYFRDLYFAFKSRLSYLIKSKIIYTNFNDNIKSNNYDYGYMKNMDSLSFDELCRRSDMKNSEENNLLVTNYKSIEFALSKKYLEAINELAKEKKAKLMFLYIPFYGSRYSNSKDLKFYQQYGNVIIPPDSIINDSSNWANVSHLNEKGAKKLSKYLATIFYSHKNKNS